MESTVLLTIAIACGFYMAWNIGANDVANAFGTTVGSGSLTIKHAIFLAAIFEFAGAFLVGEPVAKTISDGIIRVDWFTGSPDGVRLLAVGMMGGLLASSIWLNIATFFGQPVSTTHAIIGAVIGFAAVAAGPAVVKWDRMAVIAGSWIVSPVFGGVLAFAIYRWGIQRLVLASRHPVYRAIAAMPLSLGALLGIIAFSIVYQGLPGLHLDMGLTGAGITAVITCVLTMAGTFLILRSRLRRHGVPRAQRYEVVEKYFGYLQIATACYMSFAHGANDVANAVGPLASCVDIFRTGKMAPSVVVPTWLLGLGGLGIVLGLATYGYKVIEAVGKKITEMTPTRGFAASFGTATSVLVFSKLGMPISTTFVIVGAVMGVGFARGFGAIDLRVIRQIFASWLVTIPVSAVLSAVVFWILRAILSI
jgi:PiT family inorganic phosphate transporter